MLISFFKMHAQGNDFVVRDLRQSNELPPDQDLLAKAMCDRRFGIGADGLVIISASDTADARMSIFNSDGSPAAMCGSALRCVCWYLGQSGPQKHFSIATDSGIKMAEATPEGAIAELGTPRFAREDIQLQGLSGSVVDIGNLHFVAMLDDLTDAPHLAYGPRLESDPTFAQGLNSQFIHISSPQSIEMLIWERGCGATFACGTGAVASVFTGISKGLLAPGVTVKMPGGTVLVTHTSSGAYTLSGDVRRVFTGDYEWKI